MNRKILMEREKEISNLQTSLSIKKFVISENQKSESELHSEAENVLSNLKNCLKDIDEYNSTIGNIFI
jgi:hypothetical protein